MHKTLTIRETQNEIVLRIRTETNRHKRTDEIARFSKCGVGYVALGAAGRAIINGVGYVDEISFYGHRSTYDMLVKIGVLALSSRWQPLLNQQKASAPHTQGKQNAAHV